MKTSTIMLDAKSFEALQRHKFVTFWLWLGIIFSIGKAISGVMELTSTDTILSFTIGMDAMLVGLIGLAGYLILFEWMRAGFYIILVTQVLDCVLTFVAISPFTSATNIIYRMLPAVITIIVLVTVLRIKKDGITYWKAMALQATRQPETEEVVQGE